MEKKGFIPAESLIPHRRRMQLIKRVKAMAENNLQAETTAEREWPLAREGMVSSLISAELVAQAISAWSTLRHGKGAAPRIGLLVGIKEAEFSKADIPVRTPLTVQIEKLYHVENYAVFRGQVHSQRESFCKILIQVMEPEESFLATLKATRRVDRGRKETDR